MTEASDHKTIRILLVEDDADTARGTIRLLTQAGYRVAHVATGADALKHVCTNRPDLVLQDRILPDGDGLEICRQIKTDPALQNIFVVMISSSHASETHRIEGLESGADGYIPRPVGDQEMLAQIKAFARMVKVSRNLRENNETLQTTLDSHSKAEARAAHLLEEAKQASRVLLSMAEDQAAAAASLSESEQKFRELAGKLTLETQRLHESQAVANVGSWETDLATLEVNWTAETFRIFETSAETFRPSHQTFLELVHPDDREAVDRAFVESTTRSGPFAIEHRIRLPDGRIKHVEQRWQIFPGTDGQPARAIGTCQDITARKESEEWIRIRASQQETVARIGFAATQATTLEEIFDLTSRSIAEALDVEYCKILQLAPDGSHLRLVSGVGWKPGLVGVATVQVDAGSQAAFTLKEGKAIYVNDLRTDQRFVAPPLLVDHDIVSGLSVPINLRDKPWGVLGAHCRSARRFNEEDCRFMESLATLLAVVIERLAIQRNLSESDRRMREAQRIARLGNWELNLLKNELSWSDEVYRIFGQERAGFGATFESFLAMVHPEDRERVIAARERALSGNDILMVDHRILRPDGEVRHVRERGEVIRDEAGVVVALAGTVLDITEQVRGEAERERMFNLSIDLLSIGNFEGSLEQVNPAWTRCLGWEPAEITSRPWLDFVHPDDHPATIEAGEKLKRGESLNHFENRYICKDGSYRWLSWNSHPLPETGQIFGVCRDVTEQRQRQQQLRLLETCVSRLNDIVMITEAEPIDEPGPRILFVNDAFVARTGFTREETIGKSPRILQGPNTQRDVLDRIRAALKAWKPVREELINYTKSGEEFWLEVDLVPVADATGWFTHWVAIERDITERKKVEAALAESEERFRLMIEGSEQVIFYTHDREHRFTYLSPSTKAVLGYAPEELVGLPYEVLVIDDDPLNASVHDLTDRTLADGKPVEPYLIAVRHKDGRRIVMEIIESPLFHDDRIAGIQGFAKDITERMRAEAALQESEAHLQFALESSQMGDWELDLATGTARHSLRHDRCFGYTEPLAEWSFEKFIDHVHPDDRARVERDFRASVETHTLWNIECRVIWTDGSTHWIAAQGNVFLIDGKASRMHGIVRDITMRKNANERLRQNQTMLRIAGSAAKLGGWSLDLSGHKITWSDETAVIHDLPPGYSPSVEEAIAYYPPEVRDEISEHLRLLASDGIPFDFEHELITARQRRIWVRAIGEAQRDDAGKIVRLQGALQDITERKLAELEISRTNRALKMLSMCNEALVRAENEAALLAAFCENSSKYGGYPLVWVGYAQTNAARSITCEARFGDQSGYLDTIRLTWDETEITGQGPAGRVIRSGQPFICSDFETDEPFIAWREVARQYGLRSVICLPLRNGDHTFGLLGLYSGEVNHPGADELKLLRQLADDLSSGICNIRSQHQRQRMETAIRKVATSVSSSASAKFFTDLAVNAAEAIEADCAFVARLLPGEALAARTVAAVVDGKVVDDFEYALLGTPCEILIARTDCVVTAGVAGQFPDSPSLAALGAQAYVGRRLDNSAGQPVGLIFALFRKPLADSGFALSALQIFATRAAAEFERLEADSRLREQASLLEKARDAIIVRDLDQTIRFWNQSAERLYGWTAEEALGHSAITLLYHDTSDYLTAVNATLTHGEWQGELQHFTKSGTPVMVESRWTLVNDEQGEPGSILAIDTDITERKKLEQQFLRAQRMESIGTLAGGIAHDLNNVLAPIMMSIELLKLEEQDPVRLKVLDTIETSSKRGADMVRQVLSFARGMESQQLEVQAGHLLMEIEKLAYETFPKNIEVSHEIAVDLWTVLGDPTQLHQVLLNLCVNARDAMTHGGTLTLAASNKMLDEHYAAMNIDCMPGPYVCLTVEDTGTGMPPEVLDRIFEPFFTTKEPNKGTGLGLSTTAAIIKSHGGFVRVYSETGVGTRFHVYIPAKSDSNFTRIDNPRVVLPRGQNQLILVIDDEAAIRQITRQTLESFGYRVMLASDGAEAVAIYGSHQQDIAAVIIDMMMPIMDGPATIRVLMRMNPEVRIIAASGLNAGGMVAKATNIGVKHFIPKPYTAETLLTTLHSVIHT